MLEIYGPYMCEQGAVRNELSLLGKTGLLLESPGMSLDLFEDVLDAELLAVDVHLLSVLC